jgi:hypothetical protein
MRRVLATDHDGELYRRRNVMIEPVFGHTKFNRRIERFQHRGRAAARSIRFTELDRQRLNRVRYHEPDHATPEELTAA